MIKFILMLVAASLIGCGSKPKPFIDAGPEDAGDAGQDAGRMRGSEPPTGYSTALELPASNTATVRVGVSAVMVLDPFAHPIIAAIHTDPNNDGIRVDDALVFTRWNGLDKTADGGTINYQSPITIATVGEIDLSEPNRQVALSRDPMTGTIGIAYVTEQKTIKIALSRDEGVTWSLETASLPNASGHLLSNPALVLNDGVTHLAYFETEAAPCGTPECGQVIYRRRVGKAAFTDAMSPAPVATSVILAKPIALAVDSAGDAAVAYFTGPTAPIGPARLLFWRPAGTATTQIADSGGVANTRLFSVSLTFSGTSPRAAFHLPSSTLTNTQLWYASANDAAGSVFTPVEIPRNGTVTTLEGTSSFQAIALDSGGKIAIAANHVGPTVDQGCKGGPKLSRSSNGTAFTTCRPDMAGASGVFGFAGLWINAAFHKPDKVTLAFTYDTNSNPSIKGGVIVFRQP